MNSDIYIYFKCPDCKKDLEEAFFDQEQPDGAIDLFGHKDRYCDCGCTFDVRVKGEITVRKQQ